MKLSPITYIVCGFCIFLIAVFYGYSQFAPNMDEAGKLEENATALNAEGDKKSLATKRVAKATAMMNVIDQQWQDVVDTSTPPTSLAEGGIDLNENAWQLVIDSHQFRNNIQRAVNQQVKKGGVKVLQGPQIPFSPESASTILTEFYNYPAIKYPVVIFDLGTIQVEGTYEQITANMRSWAHMPHYLAVADGLRIEGTSPKLRATYSVSMIGFIRGSKIFPPVPESASSASTVGGFGGFGGGGAGIPGPGGIGGGAGRFPTGGASGPRAGGAPGVAPTAGGASGPRAGGAPGVAPTGSGGGGGAGRGD